MATVRKFGNKWRVGVRKQGHKRMSKMFTTKSDAQRWGKETEIALERGDQHNLSNKTVSDAIERLDFPRSLNPQHRAVFQTMS